MMKRKTILIIAFSAILITAVLVSAFFILRNITDEKTIAQTEPAPSTVTLPSTQVAVATPSEAIVETTKPPVAFPSDLKELLSRCEKTTADLEKAECRQLITVDASGSTAQIDFYSLVDNVWEKNDALSCDGYVGANGVTDDMHEGSYASPRGLYSVRDAFYINEPPVTGLSLFQITEDTYWVDDPDSVYYNQHIEGTENKDWNSAEHMIDATIAYEYGFVIDYNTEAVYNAGSAIFFHVSYNPTAGCVGTDREMVLKYLAKLDAKMQPYILIV